MTIKELSHDKYNNLNEEDKNKLRMWAIKNKIKK